MSSLHWWNGDERWTPKIHEKIGVGGGERVWNYPVSNVPNFLENGVILKKDDHANTPWLQIDDLKIFAYWWQWN